MMRKLLSLLLAVLLLAGGAAHASGDLSGRVQHLAEDILSLQLSATGASDAQAYLGQAQVGAEWYVLSLHQTGSYDLSAYRQRLEAYLQEKKVPSPTTRMKYALLLMACGSDDARITSILEESAGQQGLMSWVWALHLMNNGASCTSVTTRQAIDALLAQQRDDGGWVLSGSLSDVDVTAMTLQALAPHLADSAVAAAAERAVALLSSRQMEDGGLASYGTPNPESAAQTLIALSALGIDGLSDPRFIKNGCTLLDGMLHYQLEDGSFSHTLGGASNGNATAQVYQALAAWQRLMDGKGSLYLLDKPAPSAAPPSYKAIASAVILAVAVVICLALFLLKKRHPANYLAVLFAAALLIIFVAATDFQSAQSYYTGQPVEKNDPIGTVTLSIRCDTVAGRAPHIPADGAILAPTVFPIVQGDTVFTILTEAARTHGLHMESSGAPGMMYVPGIGNLYEFDFGELSGWVYHVNGASASVGCDQYVLRDGDVIDWLYSCSMGNDLP